MSRITMSLAFLDSAAAAAARVSSSEVASGPFVPGLTGARLPDPPDAATPRPRGAPGSGSAALRRCDRGSCWTRRRSRGRRARSARPGAISVRQGAPVVAGARHHRQAGGGQDPLRVVPARQAGELVGAERRTTARAPGLVRARSPRGCRPCSSAPRGRARRARPRARGRRRRPPRARPRGGRRRSGRRPACGAAPGPAPAARRRGRAARAPPRPRSGARCGAGRRCRPRTPIRRPARLRAVSGRARAP